MIRDPKLLRELDDRLAAQHPVDVSENRRIFEELWRHAVKVGALPPADPLDGIDVKIRLAKCLNALKAPRASDSHT